MVTQADFLPLLQAGIKNGQDAFSQAQAGKQATDQAKLAAYLKGQTNQQGIEQSIAGIKQLRDSGVAAPGESTKVGDVGVGADNQWKIELARQRADEQHEKNVSGKQEGYSKRLEHLNGFTSALQELEQRTNSTGGGGIVTNPEAKTVSTGKMSSAVPTPLMGIGELVGAVPKGTSEERKSLERFQLEYQKAMTGMRTSEEMAKREKAALGFIASGDPDLVAKGVRSLANNVRNATRTIQAGYTPEVRERTHQVMGDPMDFFNKVYQDPAIGAKPPSNPQAPPQGPAPVSNTPPPGLSLDQFKAWKRQQGK